MILSKPLYSKPAALYEEFYCARVDMENRIKEQQMVLPIALVYRLAYNGNVVAFKMGRRQGARGRISKSIRNRRATQPPAHFQRNPPGCGQLAVFPRCSLGPYGSDMGTSLAP